MITILKIFYSSLSGQILSAIVGITMAYCSYGPWALVAQSMISTFTNTLVMFFLVNWHPIFIFSFQRFKGLFDFAWKKTASNFIGTLSGQLKGYLIGYKYTMANLAIYSQHINKPLQKNNVKATVATTTVFKKKDLPQAETISEYTKVANQILSTRFDQGHKIGCVVYQTPITSAHNPLIRKIGMQ